MSELGVWPDGGCSVCAEGTDETRLVATGMDVLPELSNGTEALRDSGNFGCPQGPKGTSATEWGREWMASLGRPGGSRESGRTKSSQLPIHS